MDSSRHLYRQGHIWNQPEAQRRLQQDDRGCKSRAHRFDCYQVRIPLCEKHARHHQPHQGAEGKGRGDLLRGAERLHLRLKRGADAYHTRINGSGGIEEHIRERQVGQEEESGRRLFAGRLQHFPGLRKARERQNRP